MNTAKAALDTAQKTYQESERAYNYSCLSPAEQATAAVAGISTELDKANQEAEQLTYMSRFLLTQLQKEADGSLTMDHLKDIIETESSRVEGEIERLKSAIRTERRRFLDADPSAPTAVAGLYYTKEPDNQALIAFIVCYGAFLLFAGIAVLQNLIPLIFFDRMTVADRIKFVLTLWIIALIIAYIGLYIFT